MEFIDIDIGEDEREEILDKYKKLILEPFQHIIFHAKTTFIKRFYEICNYWFDLTDEDIDIIYNIHLKLFNFVLILDDIQDNSPKRRGDPAAHIIYGRARTITSANYVFYSTLYENVPRHLQIRVRNSVAILTQRLLKGQIMDIYWRDNFICPTEEAYMDMVFKKCAPIFGNIFNLSVIFSGKEDKNFDPLVKVLGEYYQILDDYYNLKSDQYFKYKGFCEDIAEGKFGYPIICALRNHPEDRRMLEILKMHTNDDTIKRECVELIEKYGGFEDTRNKVAALREQVSDEIDKLGGHPRKDLWMLTNQEKDYSSSGRFSNTRQSDTSSCNVERHPTASAKSSKNQIVAFTTNTNVNI